MPCVGPLTPLSHLTVAGEELSGCQCGQRRWGRIVGGEETPRHQYPWVASITSVSGAFCGGVLLGDQWLLTAAHCTHLLHPSHLTLGLAQHGLQDQGLQLEVARIVTHPSYHSATSDYDFSLVKLKERIQFGGCVSEADLSLTSLCLASPDVRPVCLPDNSRQDYSGQVGLVTGWGVTQEGASSLAPALREVNVTVMSNAECREDTLYSPDTITESMLCAGEPEGGRDSCQGDSGGPLVVADSDGTYRLIGLVSWGQGCARPGLPGIYSRWRECCCSSVMICITELQLH